MFVLWRAAPASAAGAIAAGEVKEGAGGGRRRGAIDRKTSRCRWILGQWYSDCARPRRTRKISCGLALSRFCSVFCVELCGGKKTGFKRGTGCAFGAFLIFCMVIYEYIYIMEHQKCLPFLGLGSRFSIELCIEIIIIHIAETVVL